MASQCPASAFCVAATPCNFAVPPMISETTITCGNGFIMFIDTDPATGALLAHPSDGEVTCVNGVWTDIAGMPAVAVQLNPPVHLGCS
ncbi:hypothetical protein PRIPAC_78259 [Pristionchus pacificus]|uniref:Uncharacterized protein n=1 Tax=Pristionchus pacificus TaxID=54126 RepID=A0A2A6CJ52_PRIPA|nr:hypothetical protein PRIPAC_78259 [Pristionchus pacificus]|eukprot:PDM78159.1 hypothetical protein PRIPAC_30738 [Pristionchus pacificus]